MKWISINDELPKDKTKVLIAILSLSVNAPRRYDVLTAIYRSGDYHNWRCTGSNNSFEEPTYWQPYPEAPVIEYENDPADCDHNWYEDINSRYCNKCGTVQKEKKIERIWAKE